MVRANYPVLPPADRPQTAVLAPFLLLVAFSPLPLGGYRPLPWSFNAVAVALLLILWAVLTLRGGHRPPMGAGRLAVPLALAAGLAFWMGFQAWGGADEWASPLWAEVWALLGGEGGGAAISVHPAAGGEQLMRFVTHGAVFFLAVQLGRDRHRAERIFTVLAYVGVGYAGYGLLMHLSGIDMVLWWDRWTYRDSVTSTFVNRNSYATFAGLTLLCALALLGRSISRRGGAGSAWELLALLADLLERRWALLVGACVIFSALALSHSRGGLAAFLVALSLLALLTRRGRGGGARLTLMLGAGALVLLLLLFAGNTFIRLGDVAQQSASRVGLLRLSLEAVGDSPWLGHGGGSFADVIRMYIDGGLPGVVTWGHAHNSFVEFALELGVPALLALLVLHGWIVGRCLLGLARRRRDRIYPAAGVAATTLVGVHALVDFSAQLPGVAIPFAAILGVAYAQSWPSRRVK